MSKPGAVTIHTDGASRGNPGKAAYGYVIRRDGEEDIEVGECLPGRTTNNVAEYTALVKALEHATELGTREVNVFTDSELMVKQLRGEYKVKNENLLPLYEEVIALKKNFDSVSIKHVRREQNKRADELCNEALDGAGTKSVSAGASKSAKKPPAPSKSVHEEAIECLAAVAQSWAQGNPNNPKPSQVWEQLWSILEEAGVVRKS